MVENFGDFLKRKRLDKEWSLRKFAEMIQISPEYLSKIESGERTAPSRAILVRISEKLNLHEYEKSLIFDLAAQSKTPPSLALDLVDYINEHPVIHKTLRLSKRETVCDEKWEVFANQIEQDSKEEI